MHMRIRTCLSNYAIKEDLRVTWLSKAVDDFSFFFFIFVREIVQCHYSKGSFSGEIAFQLK